MRAALRAVLLRGASTGLDLNFAGGVFSLNNTRTASPANIPGWSFSRTDTNGIATALDLAGNVIQFSTGVPRITNRGILVEEARTNSVTNSSMIGAVVGSPGTFPTTWTGTNWTVAGTGTENGLPYIDARYVGTPSGTQFLNFGANPAASAGQAWTASVYTRLVAGSLTNVTALQLTAASTGGTAASANQNVSTATLEPAVRSTVTVTAGTGATGATSYIRMTGSGAVDFTIRLYAPQLELGAFATSPIITTGAAGTRGAENAFVTGLAGLPPFTFFTEGDAGASSFPQYGAIDDGTSNNAVTQMRVGNANANNVYVQITSGGGATGANVGPTGVVFAGQTTKIASSVTSAGLRASRDGSAIATAARTVNALNRLCVGNATGTLPANGYIRRIRILPTTSTDAQLQALTAP